MFLSFFHMPQIWNTQNPYYSFCKSYEINVNNENTYIWAAEHNKQSTLTLQTISVSSTNSNENQPSLLILVCTGSMEW